MIQKKIYSYFERNEKLKVLFVFDPMDAIASELRSLFWQDGFRFVEFDNAWFKAKCALENEWNEDKVVLVFKQASPLGSTTSMLKFPLLDILCANMEYKSDDYAAFMQQHPVPQNCHEFIRKHIDELQLEKFNRILKPYYDTESFNKDIACRGLLSGYLGENQLLDWDTIIIKMFTLSTPSEEKKKYSFYRSIDRSIDIYTTLQSKLESYFAVTYNQNSEEKLKEVSPALNVTEDTPPTFLWATAADGLVPVQHSLRMAHALADHKIPFELHVFEEGDHGLSVASQASAMSKTQMDANAVKWVELAECWLAKRFALDLPEKTEFEMMMEGR